MTNLPPGVTQRMIDAQLEGEQCPECGGDAAYCDCYGDTIENSCPVLDAHGHGCGRRLVERLDGSLMCPVHDAAEEPSRMQILLALKEAGVIT